MSFRLSAAFKGGGGIDVGVPSPPQYTAWCQTTRAASAVTMEDRSLARTLCQRVAGKAVSEWVKEV